MRCARCGHVTISGRRPSQPGRRAGCSQWGGESLPDRRCRRVPRVRPEEAHIGAVNGFCLGGGFEIALSCDLLIASEAAQFGLPEITLGFFPLAGAPVNLPRSIPRVLANDLLFTGERIPAATAYAFGLVSRVVPAGELLSTVRAMAEKIAGYAPLAVRAMHELVRRQGNMPRGEAERLASTMRWAIGQTEDAKEGPRAFAEKRAPVFKGA